MSCICDTDEPTLFREQWRTARKAYKCCECGGVINTGDIYQDVTGIWNGRWHAYKTCERCADLRSALESAGCVWFGGLREVYIEYLDQNDLLEYDDEDQIIKPINHLTRPDLYDSIDR